MTSVDPALNKASSGNTSLPGKKRHSGRQPDQLRAVRLEVNVNKHAEGSCLIHLGDTQVMCTASVDQKIPAWLRGQGKGWITAEYGMLPRSTGKRMDRESTKGRPSGRTQEIQRLIGRSLRAVTDLTLMPDMQIRLDCDVLQADGGTRTAAITGAWVALVCALRRVQKRGLLKGFPLTGSVAAVSGGIVNGIPILDLDYHEDSSAATDANFVLTGCGQLVEIQATGEQTAFTRPELTALLDLAEGGIRQLTDMQTQILEQHDYAPVHAPIQSPAQTHTRSAPV